MSRPEPQPDTDEARQRHALLLMLEDLQEHRERIAQARREWIRTVDAIGDPVLVHDADLRVVRCNQAYAERAGLPFQEIIGRPYWECFPRQAGPLPACAHWRGQRARGLPVGTPPVDEFIAANGRTFVSHAYPIRGAAGAISLHVFRDVTDQRELERRTLGLNRELEAKVAARTAELESFSYSVSHDLRAPLRALDGFSSLLEEGYGGRLDDEGRRLIRKLREGVGHMQQLIDAILAFSRASRADLAVRPVDMAALAREVFAELAAAETGRRIELRIAALPPAQADRAAIRQVWANLLGNAIKFTRGRDPAVVELTGRSVEGGCEFAVTDNGAGFDPQRADKLFELFQRLHPAGAFEGTGVGLAIVKRIVDKHGGRAWAESKPGGGAAFRFFLPGRPASRAG